jgi:glycosyltransferase involved in cell wall biosynthesis
VKILAVTYCFYPHRGGSGLGHYDVLKRLVALYDNEVTVITLNYDPASQQKTCVESLDRMTVYRLSCWILDHYVAIPRPTLPNLRVCLRAVRTEYDIIYTRTRYSPMSLLGLLLSLVKRTPLLHTEVATTHIRTGRLLYDIIGLVLDWTLGRAIAGRATCVGVCKGATAMMKKMGAHRTTTIYNGVDESVFYPAAEPMKRDRARILFVGRLSFMKGADILSHIADNLDGQVDIAAAGEVRYHVSTKIKQLGYLTPEQVAQEMRQSSMLLLPSRVEGLPRVVQEAMACGLPVIATDVGGTRELIGGVGILIPAKVKDALNAINSLIGDGSWRCWLAERSVEKAAQFNWTATARSYQEVLETIVKEK